MSYQSFPRASGAITDGYVLTYSSTDGYWKPAPSTGGGGGSPTGAAGGDLSSTYPNPTVAKIQNVSVSSTSPQDGYVLTYNSANFQWEPTSQDTAAAGWQGVYEVNFASLANQSFSADGSVSIDGKTWTVANFSAATSFGIVNGEGLKFVCNTTNTDYNNSTRTSLLIGTPVTNLFPGFDINKHEIRILAQVTQNGDANFEHIFSGFEHATSPTSQNFSLGKGYNNASVFAPKETLSGSSTNPTDSTNVSDDVVIVEMHNNNHFSCKTGVYSGGWPANLRGRREKLFTTGGDLPFEFTSDVNIFFTAITVNTSGTFIATVNKLRVEVRTKGGGFTNNTASGDLSGTYPSPTVAKINGNTVATQVLGSLQDGYVLTWDNTDGYWYAKSLGDGYQHLDILNGLVSNIGSGSNTFARVGSVKIDSADYSPSSTVVFEGIFEATSSQTAELRLYNVTDGGAVSGSTLSTSANSSDYQFAGITLASGTKIYEAQIRITNGSPSSGDGVICSNAKIRIK